jgi:Flp pilus assembly pilin Flp
MYVALKKFVACESGASLIEYSLLTGLVSLVIITSIALISGNLGVIWSRLDSIIAQATSG